MRLARLRQSLSDGKIMPARMYTFGIDKPIDIARLQRVLLPILRTADCHADLSAE